jgi:hypothetical protein
MAAEDWDEMGLSALMQALRERAPDEQAAIVRRHPLAEQGLGEGIDELEDADSEALFEDMEDLRDDLRDGLRTSGLATS